MKAQYNNELKQFADSINCEISSIINTHKDEDMCIIEFASENDRKLFQAHYENGETLKERFYIDFSKFVAMAYLNF